MAPADGRPIPIRVVDLAGRTWRYHDPLHLYRWIDRRNALLRTIAAAPPRTNDPATETTPAARLRPPCVA